MFLIHLIPFALLFANVATYVEKSPRIITKDGNLIFESGLNRNISFRLNGNSRLNINDEYDLLDLLQRSILPGGRNNSNGIFIDNLPMQSIADDIAALKVQIFGVAGLDGRLRLLQNRTRNSNELMRRTQIRLRNVENRVQEILTKLREDNCKSNPCENGGTCVDMFEGFICKCTKQFEGPTCSQDVNECALYAGTDLGCQNGGQCINQFGGYSCICNAGWFGVHCNQRKANCMQSSGWELCGHGTCINTNDNFGYKCICDQGWKSNGLTPACSVDVDECTESHPPCATKCINLQGSFTCAPCPAGLTGNGLICRDLDECNHQNGGCSVTPFVPCINTYGSYHCAECPIGWSGDGRTCTRNDGQNSCAKNNNCHPLAKCSELSNTIVCTCPAGLVGSGIGPNGCAPLTRNKCLSSPCLNGGTCIDVGTSYTCICPAGFRSSNCGARANDPCTPNPCRNNGRCVARGNAISCQCQTGYSGSLCEVQSGRCGGILASENGTLKYPLYSLYDHNSQCSWVIRTNITKVLNITFTQFNLEDSAECRFDWLQINDGRTAASQVIGRFCGSRLPLGGNIISSRNQIYLWFRSDNSTSREGFELNWNSIDPVCGGLIEFTSHGTIASPGSPGPYPPNRDCRWHLKGPNDKRIKLIFFNLQIEQHSTCNHDFIEITDKISSGRLEMFCNSSNPAPLTLPSSDIEIYFHSDNVGSDSGFQIHYSTIESIPGCGGFFTDKSGTVKSPAFIEQPISCEYMIKANKGFKIRLEFSEFKMGSDDCIELFDVNPGVTTMQVGRFCGENSPSLYETLFSAVQLNFKSKGGHFTMRYTSVCSYTFESKSGVIRSPEYEKNGYSEATCTYQILAEPNQVIALNFIKFNISDGKQEECNDVYLKIIDGYEEESTNPLYCFNNTPAPMISSSNMLKLKYRTGSFANGNEGRGFIANYSIIAAGSKNCGGIYKKPNVELRVPLSEAGVYEAELECRWTIIAPTGFGIHLFWLSFQLEESTDCLYDYIEIYDSAVVNEDRKPVAKFCGSRMPPAIHTLNNVLTLKFVSDSSLSLGGFVAKYTFINPSELCGGHIFSSAGKLASPLWPANYPDGINCTWVITAPQGRQIELRITFIDLESSEACEKDWLEIRNGGSWNSSFVGKYCGRTAPQRIPSFTHQLFLNFRSDHQTNGKGFQVTWDATATGCGGYLNTQRGTFSSPYYPLPYPNDAQCEWQIKVNEGSVIEIAIEDMEMETMFSCAFDHLEIFDGITMDTKLARICELTGKPSLFITTGNAALIRFTSDSTSADRGFFISYRANCNRILTAVHGAIESPNFSGRSDTDYVNCSWTIKAPRGNKISLDFASFTSNGGIESNNGTGLYLFEDNEIGNSSRRSRIIQAASKFTSASNQLRLTLNSTLIRFRLEYAMIGCIQIMRLPVGTFNSPNYPNVYPNDVECLWEIETDYGSAIELILSGVDIEDSVNCTKDGIEVSYSRHSNHTLHTYCGKHENVTLTSSGHRLFVRFYSNGLNNGKGFSAKYRTLSSACGGKIVSHRGTITSPNYPQNYRPNLNCEWLIEVSNHHTMTLTIDELDIEEYGTCEMDVLEAYDGGEIQDGALIFRKCGQEIPNPNNWTTITNRALVVFNTDYDTEYKGFKLTFEENCGQTVLVDENVGKIRIVKPTQTQIECVWTLLTEDVTQHVVFTTTHVQLSPLMAMSDIEDEDCRTRLSGVTIFDGVDTKSPVRQTFCLHHPEAVISHGHALTIRVSLNVISEFEGFYSLMDSTCGGDLNSIRGKFSSPFYPASYPVDIECIWTITASEGNTVALTIQSLDIEQSDDCNGDYLEVRENSEQGTLLGVFCGSQVPPTTKSSKMLWIKFSSDHDIVGKGFVAEYNYVRHNEINKTSGLIESPKYPTQFRATDDYSWRITLPRKYLIMLVVEDLIDTDVPFVKIYDGYSELGAEIQYKDLNVIQSNTNVLFIKASRGPFRFRWNQISRESVMNNRTASEKSAICGNEVLTVGELPLIFNSPGYPNGYQGNLNCTWTFITQDIASHVVLKFLKVDLEDVIDCMLDSVSVSASSDLKNWKHLDKLCKKKTNKEQQFVGTPYLKLNFITDYGVNLTGFSSLITSRCGSNLSEPMGYVNISKYSVGLNYYQMQCVWQIHVQRGRRIRISFPQSEFVNVNDSSTCRTYILLKNGFSEDSPFLGAGKYCNNNIIDIPETTSNYAYIKFVRAGYQRFRLSFRYEQIMHGCSESILLAEQGFTNSVIQTPNYPNIPNPHTECIWTITAPINHIIAVDFSGQFNSVQSSTFRLKTNECDREYVQINDGGTELAPTIGRFCGPNNPDTQYSSGNILRIQFFTDLAEPRIKFTANVSLGECGGSYYAAEGVIMSPRNQIHSKRSYCDYNIIVQEGYTLNLTIDKISLPHNINCSQVSHLELHLPSRQDTEVTTMEKIDGEETSELICGDIESVNYILDENEIKLRYRIIDQNANGNSFRISYKSIGSRCGETIEAERGVLQSPEYPNGVKMPTHCFWKLRVPKGRRIKIEFVDFDTGYWNNTNRMDYLHRPFRGRITFANDFLFHSVITRVADKPPEAVYSTDNTMAISSFVIPFSRHRGFKLRFSSDEETPYCRETFDFSTKPEGTIKFERLNASAVYCHYDINVSPNETFAIHVTNVEKNSSDIFDKYFCQQTSPMIIHMSPATEKIRPDLLCTNSSDLVVRLPFAFSLAFSANNRNKLTLLELQYKLHQCGGILAMDHTDSIQISQPQMPTQSYGRLECAWVILPNEEDDIDEPFEVELSVDFKMKCDEEYFIVYNGYTEDAPHLGRFCNKASASNLVTDYGLLIEYFATEYQPESKFNVTAKLGSGCGGALTYPFRRINFRQQYRNNVECIWTVKVDDGYHIGLTFVDRFFIESSPNCVKDYIKIQQKLDSEWRDIKTICGRQLPLSINSTSTEMRLIFRSDSDVIGDGFTAIFQRNCGGIYYASDEKHTLSSPNYPFPYDNSLFCNYTILPAGNSTESPGIIVQFIDFQIEDTGAGMCLFDKVTINTTEIGGKPTSTVLCGRNRKEEIRSRNPITIIFQSDTSFSSKGFLLEYGNDLCGGIVTTPMIIGTPRQVANGNYPPNLNCIWNITAPLDYKIVIKFEFLEFEGQIDCPFDYVQVFAGRSLAKEKSLVKLCGNLTGKVPAIKIPGNQGVVHSLSDHQDSLMGFRAVIAFIRKCDREIFLMENNGTFVFDAFAGGYKDNMDCTYVFRTSPGRQIRIEFSSFHVEESENCKDDYLEIRDGAGPFADEIERFCGHNIPSAVVSSKTALFVRFVSDSTDTSSGFSATINSLQTLCGNSELEVNPNKTITLLSPGSERYLPNVNCYWRIKGQNNIHLQFEKFDLQEPNANGTCTYDSVKIYNHKSFEYTENALGSDFLYNGEENKLDWTMLVTGRQHLYCGHELPDDYYANTKEVFIKFHTDSVIEKSGFKIKASDASGCFKNYTSTQGRITIETAADCDIFINAPLNHSVSLFYGDIYFSDPDCNVEYIEVFDIKNNSSLQKICQYVDISKSLFTNLNHLRLRFKNSGFYTKMDITYLASRDGPGCGGNLYNYEGFFTNPHYPQNVRNNSNCRWNIRVPNNLRVFLRFEVFDLGAKTTCHSDYLQIIEHEADGQETVARQFCGEDNPKAYMGKRSYLSVYFHKTVNYDGTGWVLRFSGVHRDYVIPSYFLR